MILNEPSSQKRDVGIKRHFKRKKLTVVAHRSHTLASAFNIYLEAWENQL